MGKRVAIPALSVFALVLLASAGCVRVSMTNESSRPEADGSPQPVVITPAAERHDVAITAVDFEPQLAPDGSVISDKMKLLVAVENKGNRPETGLVVRVGLSSTKDGDALAQSTATIDGLVPGESKILRFETQSGLPLRSGYTLKAELDSVPGEVVLSNNLRTYQLQVTMMSE